MTDLRRLQFIAGRTAGAAHPNTLLALATAAVFAIALSVSWTTPSDAQNCPGGVDYCLVAPGYNPCSIYTSCQATGPGYTCMVVGNPNPQPEGTWKFSPKSPWQYCTSPATLGNQQSCTQGWQSCGTTYHYVSGYRACSFSCTGSWYWMACWGNGNPC